MICDPAVAEMFGLRSDPPVTPTESIYCLDGVPRAVPRPSIEVDTWTEQWTVPGAGVGTSNSFANTTARPMNVAVWLDVVVSIFSTTAFPFQPDDVVYYTWLSVAVFPTNTTPVAPPTNRPPPAPALTVALLPQGDSSYATLPINGESMSGRAFGFLPPLDPGMSYLFVASAIWVPATAFAGTFLQNVTYSALRWNAIDE